MKKILFCILLLLYSSEMIAQSMSCQELFDTVTKYYDNSDVVSTVGSTMLTKANFYNVQGTGFVVAYLKSNDYDLQGRPYIFCGISTQDWINFKNEGRSGSWGESFHKYIRENTCNCGSSQTQQFNTYLPQSPRSSSSSQFNPYIPQSPLSSMSPQERQAYYEAKSLQNQQTAEAIIGLAGFLIDIIDSSPEEKRIKATEKEKKELEKSINKSSKQLQSKTNSVSQSSEPEKIILPKKQITGKVLDKDGPLPGVSILIKGTSNGTFTDIDGNFHIEASPNDVLVFSFINLKTQEILINDKTVINLTLQKK